jgi:hypothetical protein
MLPHLPRSRPCACLDVSACQLGSSVQLAMRGCMGATGPVGMCLQLCPCCMRDQYSLWETRVMATPPGCAHRGRVGRTIVWSTRRPSGSFVPAAPRSSGNASMSGRLTHRCNIVYQWFRWRRGRRRFESVIGNGGLWCGRWSSDSTLLIIEVL